MTPQTYRFSFKQYAEARAAMDLLAPHYRIIAKRSPYYFVYATGVTLRNTVLSKLIESNCCSIQPISECTDLRLLAKCDRASTDIVL